MNNDKRLSRQELLQWINAVSFAVNDVTLFLDTHPDDAEALEYFEEFRTQRTRALRNIPEIMGRSRSILQLPLHVNAGSGAHRAGHGRKEAVNLCGIMKSVCNIR